MFPPGFAKLATTISGSPVAAMTMDVVVVAFFAARTAGVPLVTITSMFKRSKSAARSANRSPWPSAERYSIMRFCSSMYPRSRKLWRNASKFAAFNSIDVVSSTPMRQTLPGCCARAASGHAAAPPSSDMKARRFIRSPRRHSRLPDGVEHLTACGDRLGRYLREGDDAGRRALVHPVVDGAALDQHIAGLGVHAPPVVELHIDLARDHRPVVDRIGAVV